MNEKNAANLLYLPLFEIGNQCAVVISSMHHSLHSHSVEYRIKPHDAIEKKRCDR